MGSMKDHYFGDNPYPAQPGWKAPGTSQAAARAVSSRSHTLRDAVLTAIRNAPQGMTADEAAASLGETVLAVRPRLSELKRLGEIEPTGVRRANASGLTAGVFRATVKT